MEIKEKEFLNYFIRYIYETNSMKYDDFETFCSHTTISKIINNILYCNDAIYEDILAKLGYDFSYEEYFFSNKFEEDCQQLYTAILYCDEERMEKLVTRITRHCITNQKCVVEEVYASIFKTVQSYYVNHNSLVSFEEMKIAKHFKPLFPNKLIPIINQLLFVAYYSRKSTSCTDKISFSKENHIFDDNDPLLFPTKLIEMNYTSQHIKAFQLAEEYEQYYEQTNNQIRKFDMYRKKLLIALNADQGLLTSLLEQSGSKEIEAKAILPNSRLSSLYYQLGVIYFCLENFDKAYDYFKKVIDLNSYSILESIIICNYIAFKKDNIDMYLHYTLNKSEFNSYFGRVFILLEMWICEFTQQSVLDYNTIKAFLLENKKSLGFAGRGMHSSILEEIIHDTAKHTHYYNLLSLIK